MNVELAPISFVYENIGFKFSLGSCKHNEHWGLIFKGTLKTVFHILYGICVSVYGGVDNSELIIIFC